MAFLCFCAADGILGSVARRQLAFIFRRAWRHPILQRRAWPDGLAGILDFCGVARNNQLFRDLVFCLGTIPRFLGLAVFGGFMDVAGFSDGDCDTMMWSITALQPTSVTPVSFRCGFPVGEVTGGVALFVVRRCYHTCMNSTLTAAAGEHYVAYKL